MVRQRILTALLAVLCWGSLALAQSPRPGGAIVASQRLAAYLNGKEQMEELYAVGRHWDGRLGLQQDCQGSYHVQPVNLFLLKPVVFPEGRPHPVAGAWQHRFVFERCGKRRTYNALFLARDGRKPEARPYLPGTTNASPTLVADALKGAYPAALLRLAGTKGAKGCQEAEPIDTRLVQPPRTTPGPWEEVWTFRGCGHEAELAIAFSPDGKGGTFYTIKGGR